MPMLEVQYKVMNFLKISERIKYNNQELVQHKGRMVSKIYLDETT